MDGQVFWVFSFEVNGTRIHLDSWTAGQIGRIKQTRPTEVIRAGFRRFLFRSDALFFFLTIHFRSSFVHSILDTWNYFWALAL